MATGPRPYGIGTYGTGRYAIYSDGLMVVGGATSISLLPQAKVNYTAVSAAAASIGFVVDALPTVIAVPMAATQIRFSLRGIAALVFNEGAATQISFSLQGGLVETWQQVGPCATGGWQQQLPPWTERIAA